MSRDLELPRVGHEAAQKRILTSGAAVKHSRKSANCRPRQLAGDRIQIMVAGSIRPENVAQIATETRAQHFHAALRTLIPSAMKYENRTVHLGTPDADDYRAMSREQKRCTPAAARHGRDRRHQGTDLTLTAHASSARPKRSSALKPSSPDRHPSPIAEVLRPFKKMPGNHTSLVFNAQQLAEIFHRPILQPRNTYRSQQ